tara:strand:+ start:178 stop:1680 length:1503 start_codon:yes stop_codon:yes gene_type:complete
MENNSNRWFFNCCKKDNDKKQLIKFLIRATSEDDMNKFKSIFHNSGFCRKNQDTEERDKVHLNKFYTMEYNNSKSKDISAYHTVCYTKEEFVMTLKNQIESSFKISFKYANKKTISLTINPNEPPRGCWTDNGLGATATFPICILSYDRANQYGRTHKFLTECDIKHYLFVEENEYDKYEKWYNPLCCTLIKGDNFSNQNFGSTPMRNYILDYWKKDYKRVWMLDDNIKSYKRFFQGVKNKIKSYEIFKSVENYIINYDNVGIASHNLNSFITEGDARVCIVKNGKSFSSMLIKTDDEIRFKYKYNEDHLISMEYIEKGYCCLCFNNVLYEKNTSGEDKGGNRKTLYKKTDEDDGYKEKYEYFEKVVIKLIAEKKLTLGDDKNGKILSIDKFVSRSKTMKSKKYHAEVNYDALKNHNNDIILVDDIFVEPPLLMFKEYDSSSISSEEQPKEIEPDEVEEEPDEVEEKDKKILYIINNFIDRKKALEDEEKELQRLFPDYF